MDRSGIRRTYAWHTIPLGYLLTAILIGMALLCGVATAGTLTYSIGGRLPLNGTAYATNTLYIFLTGPGLDPME